MTGFFEVWQDIHKRYFIKTVTKYPFNGDDKLIKKDIQTYDEAMVFILILNKLKSN